MIEVATRTRTKSKAAAAAAATLATVLLLTGVAYGNVSALSPSSGVVPPGDSKSSDFTLTPPSLLLGLGTSCILASVSPNPHHFTVTFDGLGLELLPANCALGATPVTMTVRAHASAAPGNYSVTITEIEPLNLGGDLITTQVWPFVVLAPTTTTVPSNPPTAPAPPPTTSTTNPSPVTTSTSTTSLPGPSPSPSTSVPTPTVTSPEPPVTDTPTPGAVSPGTTEPPDTGVPTIDGDSAREDERDTETIAAPPDDDGRGGGGIRPPDPSSDGLEEPGLATVTVTNGLRSALEHSAPSPLVDAFLSPLVIAEVLLGALLADRVTSLLPLLLILVFGGWLLWKMKREDDDEAQLGRSHDRIA